MRPDTSLADPAARRGAVFAVGVLVALFTGYAIGRVTPTAPRPAPAAVMDAHTMLDGLSAVAGGYSLSVANPTFGPADPAAPRALRFVVRGPDGAPVARYETVHEKLMHLVVVRSDLFGYQHLHPILGKDGVWSTTLSLGAAGTWRMYAEFTPAGGGAAVVLGAALTVPGSYGPLPGPGEGRVSTVDGFTVTLGGSGDDLWARVTGDGGRAVPLDRYLGAFGHLVALREADQAYLHVHPDPALADGAMRFRLATPRGPAVRYRVFVEFSTAGVVHTAEFAVTL